MRSIWKSTPTKYDFSLLGLKLQAAVDNGMPKYQAKSLMWTALDDAERIQIEEEFGDYDYDYELHCEKIEYERFAGAPNPEDGVRRIWKNIPDEDDIRLLAVHLAVAVARGMNQLFAQWYMRDALLDAERIHEEEARYLEHCDYLEFLDYLDFMDSKAEANPSHGQAG